MDSPRTQSSALEHFSRHSAEHLEDLKSLVRIPSISFPGFDPKPLVTCANAISALMIKSGLQDVRLLETDSGNHTVFGQWTHAAGKPTVLLYAHYDVQPIGREELWISPPFEPVVRQGRLFGRGTADDKAGIMLHLAAIRSYLGSSGNLPVNVKVLIEGEEEVGSINLNALLVRHKALLGADMVLIADSENFESGIPSLTASLRGIVSASVEVQSLLSSVHSGTWGGPLPDPVLALARMLSGLVDDQGRPAIRGMTSKVRDRSRSSAPDTNTLPFSESTFRSQARLCDGVQIIGGDGSVYDKMWHRPSIAVNAIEASSRKQAANIINDRAWTRIGIRIVPDMDAQETLDLLSDHLMKSAPWGVKVTIIPESPSQWWTTDIHHPAFGAAYRSLERGYGRKPVIVGAGGSIPFVQTITEALGNAPAILFGVGDPYTGAHSENESLLLADWEKGCRSLVLFLAQASELRS